MAFTATPRQTTVPRRATWQRLRHFLVVAGPGLIVMVADNYAGAVSTYTQAGAQYGTTLLWLLLLLLPVTYFVQEMVGAAGHRDRRGPCRNDLPPLRHVVGPLLADRSPGGKFPDADDGVRRHCAGGAASGVAPGAVPLAAVALICWWEPAVSDAGRE